jgi:hypothetical protein
MACAERFDFAAFGDTPYFSFEEPILVGQIQDMNQKDLAFVIHIGDIKSGSDRCADFIYESRLAWFNESKHPFILIPGDNDWTDCRRSSNGGYDPLERLNFFRRTFYKDALSLGQRQLTLERQSTRPEFAEYRENMRWRHGGVVFATVHVVGSSNNEGTAEFALRNRANIAWLKESFSAAKQEQASAMVVALHADPLFEISARDRRRSGLSEVMDHFLGETKNFAKPVLLIHGDSHRFRFDQPLSARGVSPSLRNLTRLEVHGSPKVAWTQVQIDTRSPGIFSVATRRTAKELD